MTIETFYHHYLSMRFNWKAFSTPPMPLVGSAEDNLVLANLVMQGTLYGKDRLIREMIKRGVAVTFG